ncbi:hypothetical protein pneo_cds_870 [Pandoravirus neocaledonia]|uniref:Uncharacterized protein n=1 Tax=Pandoravirus neocaledonia TaxID=2107708 RepID=A0A2U7UDH2_9VIRU|nr:hypothetical protein pneo_cds_870 [Pandoravirus neocaledonia]AVK76477.1 hypothetical protein pneo_cds_870 [Pandoravirus neocaledonia]
MLRWPSPWHTAPAAPPPKTPSVIDKWLVDTGRKPLPLPPPRARYTARGRRGVQRTAPSATATPSLSLIWPTRSSGDVPTVVTTTTSTPKDHPFDASNNEQSCERHAPTFDAFTGDGVAEAADQASDAMWEDPSYTSIYQTSPTEWRERITEMIDMGMSHYNVCNCVEGAMPTKDDIERYDALFREVVAENPEVGEIEVIPGYPPIYVLLGAADAAQLYAERRQRERDERRRGYQCED